MYMVRMVADQYAHMKRLWWRRLYGRRAQLYDDVRTLQAVVASIDNEGYRTVGLVPIISDITYIHTHTAIYTVGQKIGPDVDLE